MYFHKRFGIFQDLKWLLTLYRKNLEKKERIQGKFVVFFQGPFGFHGKEFLKIDS